ncbi:CehA/McbA family metallohydrolase [Scatolibacter rhodanostii]|uniref:CehA/McbA family metallohydrolase n=1 Tax=Scatolibacter rhodanostii TaxID=2014781 RepID=UPI000C07AFFD|nr:CehA/McbA family metallohydrolase [Scatolibacter rhodanostii]
MFVRAELHNHSTHSDGTMTVEELIDFAAQNKFGTLALTDHNTVSGHSLASEITQQKGHELSFLPGVEVTTFFGHILALGLTQMIPFTHLNPKHPEAFLAELHAAGARAVGIAHPYCVGEPIMIGCRFGMTIHDWSVVDYIEVVNTSIAESEMGNHPLAEALSGNEQALALWEILVLGGHRIAAVTGKDIHKPPLEANVFTTFVQIEDKLAVSRADAVIGAILSQKTMITKGPLFETSLQEDKLVVKFDNSSDYLNWNNLYADRTFILELTDSVGNVICCDTDMAEAVSFPFSLEAQSAVVKLYEDKRDYEHLLAVGSPIYRTGGNLH